MNTIHRVQRQQFRTILLGLDAKKYSIGSFDYISSLCVTAFSSNFLGNEPGDIGEFLLILDIAYG
ncbi:hypothetical protein DMW99_00170 [Pseudomonas chlororaphis]|nr:hypothetical protein C1Y36_24050 [Pseudomonas sp. FW306-2-2C-D06C]PYC41813.1 hypothetical protein DMW99_00170 [Pseudomonas chlororaphis]